MSVIQLHSENLNSVTTISNIFIDQYMPNANGEFVKVYLYLLRCLNHPTPDCSISTIADCFNHTEKDVIRALKYWEKVHLLSLEFGADKSITGICLLDIQPTADAAVPAAPQTRQQPVKAEKQSSKSASSSARAAAAQEQPSAPPAEAAAETVPARREYTLNEVKTFRQDPNISELFFIIETYLKHPLSTTDINMILYWHEELHFSTELIVYLVEYCICKGHSSMRYMDKVALGWHESHIVSIEDAKANAAMHSQAYYAVMKALGINGRNLVDSETAYVQKWTKEYAFDLSIIQEACRRTIAATHQPSFEYTDSILSSWYKNQVHTPEDIEKLDAAHSRNKKSTSAAPTNASAGKRNKFNNFNQRDYDYDQLEKMLLTTSPQ